MAASKRLKAWVPGAVMVLLGAVEVACSAGCGNAQEFAGTSQDFTLQSGGRTRNYRVHLPTNYDENDERPLLLGFHGSGGNQVEFEEITHYSDEDLNPDWISVFPTGVNNNWQGPTYATEGVDDLQFTSDLVAAIKAEFCIDEGRVYAVGHSNGGGFTNTIACSAEHSAQFAAFAATAPALYTDWQGEGNCTLSRVGIPFFELHGTADNTIPYTGGEGRGGPLPDVQEWLSRWQERNNCGGPVETEYADDVKEFDWTCEGVEGLLRHFQLVGHSHAFPGASDPQLFATPVVLEWLSQWAL